MSRITEAFRKRQLQSSSVFVGYLTAGDPDLQATKKYCKVLAEAGVDIIELGVPFSDPLADGPTNQKASERALASGTSLSGILTMISELRAEGFEAPLVIFSYLNPIHAMGYENFAARAKQSDADGVLCVDMPPEEAESYQKILRSQGLDTVFLASPTTEEKRLQLIEAYSSGFVYYVSRTGVTGVQAELSQSLQTEVGHIKEHIKKPLAIGFGISTPEQAKQVSQWADGIVIGSAIVNIIAKASQSHTVDDELRRFVKSIRDSLD